MLLEFIVAIAGNVSSFFWFMACVSGVAFIICSLVCLAMTLGGPDGEEKEKTPKEEREIITAWKIWWRILIFGVISLMVGSLPKIEDLWKVRVGLIKLELASPENIKKGSDAIERVAKRLECRYIGCDEEKPKETKESEKK